MSKADDNFLGWVQLHERTWGTSTYPGRPSLEAIMQSPVVTFWRQADNEKDLRYKIKLYEDLKDLERFYTKLLLRLVVEIPKDRLVRVYVHRKRYALAAARIMFREVPET